RWSSAARSVGLRGKRGKTAMRRFRWFGGLACAALLSLAMAGAWAQDEGETPAVAPEYEVEVTLESGEVLRGRLRDEGDTLVIETADGPVAVPRADVTGIQQGDPVPLP